MGKQSKVTIGHRFFFGIHMGICRGPADELVEIKVGDRTAWKYDPTAPGLPSEASFSALAAWKAAFGDVGFSLTPPALAMPAYEWEKNDCIAWNTPITANQTIRIKAANIFGGEESEGGIDGTCDILMGEPDQPVNSRLATMLGGLVPAFRGSCMMFFDGMVSAMSKYPKPWSFRMRRALKGWDGEVWYPAKAIISLDGGKIKAMNPAHIIYECLTNRDWGRGIERARIDDAAFTVAADTFYAEGFGLCLKWSRQEKIGAFIQIVQDHVGANLFLHRVTGLWTLRAVRDDYVVSSLPLFTPDTGLLAIEEDDNAASVVGANEIIVTYFKPVEKIEGQVRVQNAAGIRAAGGIISETVNYLGIPTPELASRTGQRDLRTKFGLKRFKIRLDRRGYKIEPGGVFRISDPAHGIENLVLRAGRIEDGTLASGAITVNAVMDVFGLPANAFVGVQTPIYTPPNLNPQPITLRKIREVTYRDIAATLSETEREALTPGTGFICSIAAAPNGFSQSYFLDTKAGTANWRSATGDFSPTATIQNAIPVDSARVTVTLATASELTGVLPGSAAEINNEIFRVDNVNTAANTVRLARGCVDTVPQVHASGSRIFFYEDYFAVDKTEYANGVSVSARLRTQTGAGVLAESLAPVDTFVMAQRYERPYPPGNVKINGVSYPAKISGSLSLSWAIRNRILQADQLIDQTLASVGGESGVTTNVIVSGEGGYRIASDTVHVLNMYNVDRAVELSVGAISYASTRDLRLNGFGVDTSPAGISIGTRGGMRISGGWMSFGNQGGWFVDGSTGALTERTFTATIAVQTLLLGFDLNSTVHRVVDFFDAYPGWSVLISNNNKPFAVQAQDPSNLERGDSLIQTIVDRRSAKNSQLCLGYTQCSLVYWGTNRSSARMILRRRYTIHNVLKNAVVTGPLASARTVFFDYYTADMGQFDNADGVFNSGFVGDFNGSSIIFGSLLYVPGSDVLTSESTAGKPLSITNVLTTHLTIATQLKAVTRIFSIDVNGNIAPLAVRAGLILADQVSLTIGVEVSSSNIRTVNSSTGALGAVIATFSGTLTPTHVVGDPSTDTFYVAFISVTLQTIITHYDLSGTVLLTLDLELNRFGYSSKGDESLCITAGYLYYGFGSSVAGYIYRMPHDLSAVHGFDYSTVNPDYGYENVGGAGYFLRRYHGGEYNGVVRSDYNSPLIHADRLFDENAVLSAFTPLATPRLHNTITVELSGDRDGLISYQKHTITTKRNGYGMRYGTPYGS